MPDPLIPLIKPDDGKGKGLTALFPDPAAHFLNQNVPMQKPRIGVMHEKSVKIFDVFRLYPQLYLGLPQIFFAASDGATPSVDYLSYLYCLPGWRESQ